MTALKKLRKTWNLQVSGDSDLETVRRLLNGLSDVPYENLTKILSGDRERDVETLARDHLEHGTGGTCFSLVRLFLRMARERSLDAQPILADRSYGPNTHCAAVVRTEQGEILADPGFLIHQPVRREDEQTIALPHTTVRKDAEGRVFTVYPDGHEKFRYELHEEPVSDADFRDLWRASLNWDMMNQLVVNHVVEGTHVYLRDRYLHRNRRTGSEQDELARDEVIDMIEELGIDPSIARAAVAELDL